MDIRIKLQNVLNEIREEKGLPSVDMIEDRMNLRDDLGFDSLGLASLTVQLEDEFDVDVFEDGLVFTVGEIIEKLEGR